MTADPRTMICARGLRRLEHLRAVADLFITACSFHRSRSCDARNPQRFLSFATDGEKHDYVGNYTIMPDHIHLFVALNRM